MSLYFSISPWNKVFVYNGIFLEILIILNFFHSHTLMSKNVFWLTVGLFFFFLILDYNYCWHFFFCFTYGVIFNNKTMGTILLYWVVKFLFVHACICTCSSLTSLLNEYLYIKMVNFFEKCSAERNSLILTPISTNHTCLYIILTAMWCKSWSYLLYWTRSIDFF